MSFQSYLDSESEYNESWDFDIEFDDTDTDDYSDDNDRYGPGTPMYGSPTFSNPTSPSYSQTQSDIPVVYQAKSLQDICCKYLALNFPFGYLQDRCPPVPDDLQLKVITLSFPNNEDKLKKYAEFSKHDIDMDDASGLCDMGRVTDMMQIGKDILSCFKTVESAAP